MYITTKGDPKELTKRDTENKLQSLLPEATADKRLNLLQMYMRVADLPRVGIINDSLYILEGRLKLD